MASIRLSVRSFSIIHSNIPLDSISFINGINVHIIFRKRAAANSELLCKIVDWQLEDSYPRSPSSKATIFAA